jgi:hypothetical protein
MIFRFRRSEKGDNRCRIRTAAIGLSLRRSRRPPVGSILRFVQVKDRARARIDGAPAVVQCQA